MFRSRASRLTTLFVASLGAALAAGVVHCVGDAPTVLPDAGPDGNVPDATGDAPMPPTDGGGDGGDGGAPCVIPDAGMPGSLDTSFNAQLAGFTISALAVAVDGMGRVYVAGQNTGADCTGAAYKASVIVRFKADGNVDTSFGGKDGGKPGEVCIVPGPYTASAPSALAVAADGKSIYGAGLVTGADAGTGWQAALFGLDDTGAALPNFPGGIYVDSALPAYLYDLAIDADGKLVAVGSNKGAFEAAGTTGYVVRYTTTPGRDLNFNGGNPVVDTGAIGYFGVAIRPNKAGLFAVGGSPSGQARVLALTQAGVNEPSFGDAGVGAATIPGSNAGYSARSAQVLGGHLYFAGAHLGAGVEGPLSVSEFAASGAGTDPGFAGGTVAFPNGKFNRQYMFHMLSSQCDGKVLVGGRVDPDAGADGGLQQRVAVARLLPNGTLDPSFGTAGVSVQGAAIHPLTSPIGIAQDPVTGKLVVVGRDGLGRSFLLRINP